MSTAPPVIRDTTTIVITGPTHSITIGNGIAPGDLMLLIIEHLTSTGAPVTPAGWTLLVSQPHGSRTGYVYAKVRQNGDVSVAIERSGNGSGRAMLAAYAGVDPDLSRLVIGAVRSRSTTPTDTSYATTANGITTTRADTLVVGIFGEATTAAEAAGFVPSLSRSDVTYQMFQGQQGSTDVESIFLVTMRYAASGSATGAVVATYPNAQASNGWGVLIGMPSVVSDGTIRKLPAKMSDGAGKVIDVGLTAMTSTGEVALSAIELVHSGSLVPDLLRMSRVFTMAHRGGSADYQEHTMRGYVQSAIAHVDALEFSVARTSDGVFFGAHDETLNRTTSGLAANYKPSEHTWAEISQLRQDLSGRGDPRFTTDRYYTLDEFLAQWGKGSHAIFLDPKVLTPADRVALLDRIKLVPNYRDIFVGKFFHSGVGIADEFAAAGIATWGYAYPEAITGLQPNGQATAAPLLSATVGRWTMIGMDYTASDDVWATTLAIANGKKVIGHIVPNATAAREAVAKGANALQVSGINSVALAF